VPIFNEDTILGRRELEPAQSLITKTTVA